MPDSISTSSSSPRIPALSDLTLSSPNPSPSILTYSSFLDPSHSRTSTPAPPPAPSPTLDPSDPAFEFGEAVFHKRRAAWRLQAGNAFPQAAPEEETAAGGSSMDRLESLLDGPGGSDVGEEGWRAGLEGVHRGLLGGRRLVKRMKLSLVIKVLRAGWIRDGTWPASLPPVPPSPPYSPSDLPTPSPYSPDASSSVTPTHISTLLPPASISLPPPPTNFQSAGSATSTPSQTTTTPGSASATSETTPDVEAPVRAKPDEDKRFMQLVEEEEGTPTEEPVGLAP